MFRHGPRFDDRGAIPTQECTRVLLADLETMPRQLIEHALGSERDIELFEAPAGASLPQAVGAARADVVVIGNDDPALAAEVLRDRSSVRVLAVTGDARNLLLYELRPLRIELGELSRDALLREVRDVRWSRSSWAP